MQPDMAVPDVVVEIIVESGDGNHFVVLRSDGHEIERRPAASKDEAMRVANFLSDYAKKFRLTRGQP